MQCNRGCPLYPKSGRRWDLWSKHPACDERNQEKCQQSEHIAAHKCFGVHRVGQEPLRHFGSLAQVGHRFCPRLSSQDRTDRLWISRFLLAQLPIMLTQVTLVRAIAMARNRRKASAGKRRKKSRTTIRKTARPRVKKRSAQTLGDKVTGAYRAVVDTIKGTDKLRNKLEPPATSETE